MVPPSLARQDGASPAQVVLVALILALVAAVIWVAVRRVGL